MNIREMRSAINAENTRKGFDTLPETMPTWAVQRLFEQRRGLPLSPLPKSVEVRSTKTVLLAGRKDRKAAQLRAQLVLDECKAANQAEEDELLKLKAAALAALL